MAWDLQTVYGRAFETILIAALKIKAGALTAFAT